MTFWLGVQDTRCPVIFQKKEPAILLGQPVRASDTCSTLNVRALTVLAPQHRGVARGDGTGHFRKP